MAQCRGVPLHDEHPTYSLFLKARFSGKKWQIPRSIFLRSSMVWFLSPCHRKGRFWSGKRHIEVLIWGLQNSTLSQMFPTLKESLEFIIKLQGNYVAWDSIEYPSNVVSAVKRTQSGNRLITPWTRLGTIVMDTLVIIGLYPMQGYC